MKKALKLIGGLFLAVLIFAVVTSIINGDNQNTQPGANPENSSQEENNQDESIKLGEKGTINKLNLVVNSVEVVETVSAANGTITYKPESGKYVVVNVTISNNTKKSESLMLNYFNLVDNSDAEYVPTIIAIADEKFITVDTINPGLEITGNLLFEIPNDINQEDCYLKYSDYSFTSEIKKFSLK